MKKSTIALLCSIAFSMSGTLFANSATTSPQLTTAEATPSGTIQVADWERRRWCRNHPRRCHREWCDRHPRACHERWCWNHPEACRARWCERHPGECW